MNRRAVLASAILLAGLVIAVVGAITAVLLIGRLTFSPGSKPLSAADVRKSFARQMADHPGTGPSQGASAPPRPGQTPESPPSRSPRGTKPAASSPFASSGGTVLASCTGGKVTLTGVIPNDGYGTDGELTGPAASAWVKFKSATAEVTVTVTCVSGRPSFGQASDERGGGGGGGRGGGGGGGH
jgi:hypothetical protein